MTDLLDRLAQLNPQRSTDEPTERRIDQVVTLATSGVGGSRRPPWLIAATIGSIIGLALLTVWTLRPGAESADVGTGQQAPAPTTAATQPPTTAGPSGSATERIVHLMPASITCSSELDDTMPCANLIDGRSTTVWSDADLAGVGAVLTINFDQPVALEQVHLTNPADADQFERSHRIRTVELMSDDLPASPVTVEIPDQNAVIHVVSFESQATTSLVIRVTSTYSPGASAVPTSGRLILAELTFWGRLTGDAPSPLGGDFDEPGPVPGAFEVVRHTDLGEGNEIELNLTESCLMITTNFVGPVRGSQESCGEIDATALTAFTGAVGDVGFVAGRFQDPIARVEVIGQGIDQDAVDGYFLIILGQGMSQITVRGLDAAGSVVEQRDLGLAVGGASAVRLVEFEGWKLELSVAGDCLETRVFFDGIDQGGAGGCGANPDDVFSPGFGSVAGLHFVSGFAGPQVATVEIVDGGMDDASDGFFLIVAEPSGPQITVRARDAAGSVLSEVSFDAEG